MIVKTFSVVHLIIQTICISPYFPVFIRGRVGGHIRSALWVVWPEGRIPRVFVSERCTGNPRGSLRPRVPVVAISQRGCGSDRPSIRMQGHCISLRAAVSTGPSADGYSAVLHELGMGVHHSLLLRASFSHAVHLSTVRYTVVTFALVPMPHLGFLLLRI